MIDLKSYHDSMYHGQRVHWGADFIFCDRDLTRALLQDAADRVSKRFGITEMPRVILDRWGSPLLDPDHANTHHHLEEWARYDISDLVYQESRQLCQYNGVIYRVVD